MGTDGNLNSQGIFKVKSGIEDCHKNHSFK